MLDGLLTGYCTPAHGQKQVRVATAKVLKQQQQKTLRTPRFREMAEPYLIVVFGDAPELFPSIRWFAFAGNPSYEPLQCVNGDSFRAGQ
jgi:hypothetical protein